MTTTITAPASETTIILIPGHWLGAWAWDEVLEHLSTTGLRAIAVTLPGLDEHDPERSSRTLEDQVAAIEEVVAQSGKGRRVVLVAHSGASAPVSIALDRHPRLVARVVWVDSGPVAPGTVFAPDAPETLTELPLPPFDALERQASLEGLSAEALERFRSRAVPEPGPVLRQPIELRNDARLDVPTTLVCCSIPSTRLLELARAGHPMFAEVATLTHRDLVDLPTGHWPMWSRPADLAETIASIAVRTD